MRVALGSPCELSMSLVDALQAEGGCLSAMPMIRQLAFTFLSTNSFKIESVQEASSKPRPRPPCRSAHRHLGRALAVEIDKLFGKPRRPCIAGSFLKRACRVPRPTAKLKGALLKPKPKRKLTPAEMKKRQADRDMAKEREAAALAAADAGAGRNRVIPGKYQLVVRLYLQNHTSHWAAYVTMCSKATCIWRCIVGRIGALAWWMCSCTDTRIVGGMVP